MTNLNNAYLRRIKIKNLSFVKSFLLCAYRILFECTLNVSYQY